MRYATLTLSPCLDQTIFLQHSFQPGFLNRFEHSSISAGGKGVNVSRMLHMLGAQSDMFGFCGGTTGKLLCDLLTREGLSNRFTQTQAATRVCVKLTDADGICSELNGRAGPIHQEEFAALLRTLQTLLRGREENEEPITVFLCGSVPYGIADGVYGDLIRYFDSSRARHVRFVLDADAQPLSLGLAQRPSLMKPNRHELSNMLGFTVDSADTALYAAKRIYEEYQTAVAVTLGAEGSVYVGEQGSYLVNAPSVAPRALVGAGDVYLATLVFLLDQAIPIETALRHAAAMAGAKVENTEHFLPSVTAAEELARRVTVRKV